jgi:hypothetical protein
MNRPNPRLNEGMLGFALGEIPWMPGARVSGYAYARLDLPARQVWKRSIDEMSWVTQFSFIFAAVICLDDFAPIGGAVHSTAAGKRLAQRSVLRMISGRAGPNL